MGQQGRSIRQILLRRPLQGAAARRRVLRENPCYRDCFGRSVSSLRLPAGRQTHRRPRRRAVERGRCHCGR